MDNPERLQMREGTPEAIAHWNKYRDAIKPYPEGFGITIKEIQMRIRIVFQDVTDEAKAAGYNHAAPLMAFVEVEDTNGKSINVGTWEKDADKGYHVLSIPTVAHMPAHEIDGRIR